MLIKMDVDGVLADMIPALLTLYNADWDDNLHYEDITDWDISKFVRPECGKKVFEYFGHPDLYTLTAPFFGARTAVAILRAQGHRVLFVTSGVYPEKIKWLDLHGFLNNPKYDNDPRPDHDMDICVLNDKSLIKADLLIDDYWKNQTDGESFILIDQPWNRHIEGLYRAKSWNDVFAWIEGLYG